MNRQVVARPAPGKTVDVDDFADITDASVENIDWLPGGWLRVRFEAALTDVQVAGVRRRIVSADPAEEQVRAELEHDLTDPPATPTLASLQAQLTRITQLLLSVGLPEGALPLPPELVEPTAPAAAVTAATATKSAAKGAPR